SSQPAFFQHGEGLRFQTKSLFAGDRLRLNYLLLFQQFLAGGSPFSFRRFTADLNHEFPIYSTTKSYSGRPQNGPDDCSKATEDHACPAITRNREGGLAFRFFFSESATSAGNAVPFYFQPTLGGADINGNPTLSSYQDYRFRAPNVMLLRQSFE